MATSSNTLTDAIVAAIALKFNLLDLELRTRVDVVKRDVLAGMVKDPPAPDSALMKLVFTVEFMTIADPVRDLFRGL